jgi:hypothetical protein
MQGTYTPETNHVSRIHNVSAITVHGAYNASSNVKSIVILLSEI